MVEYTLGQLLETKMDYQGSRFPKP